MVEEAARALPQEPNSAAILEKAVVFGGRTYTIHSRHWYDDGSFGFLVESTAFLLHRSLLARKSLVMADMFGLPQRSSSSPGTSDHTPETINGIPFVILHDKADDFTHALDIIYTGVSMTGPIEIGTTALMGLIQFANKYLFDKVKEWAVSRILSSHLLLVVGDAPCTSSLQDALYYDPKFCVRVILFARECQLPQFLPFAFYALATTDWSQKSPEDFLSIDQISPEDRWRIQEGRLKLTKSLLDRAYEMPENGCTGEPCRDMTCRKGSFSMWIDPTARWRELHLHPLEELEFRLPLEYGVLCEICRTDVVAGTRALQDHLVSHLTKFFHLD
ncbi:hypothetical protein M407DRAFT_8308 [Tulasnella calospora MUT 4182]|uniref:BTB domain-containing protein n=1 Tax=Tulasnella calospora MUT 4182 TaxID=1051891 RepID=A0A0C3Q7N9_9AGAM|nr:hypothetical protein M407DRAFT_8308 [Tulasnella calospora MUT 4182]